MIHKYGKDSINQTQIPPDNIFEYYINKEWITTDPMCECDRVCIFYNRLKGNRKTFTRKTATPTGNSP